MGKRKWILFASAAFLLVVALTFLTASRRYNLQVSGDALYKIDRLTGKTWLVRGIYEHLVATRDPTSDEAGQVRQESKALALAKTGKSFSELFDDQAGPALSNKRAAEIFFEVQEGDIEIPGWQATMVGDGVFLVSATIIREGEESGFYFEVHLNVELVRLINGDTGLAEKYDLVEKPSKADKLVILSRAD